MRPPLHDTAWSPLPRALEHLLQSYCTIPTLTPWSLFTHAPLMAVQALASRFPGGAGNAAFTGVAALLALSSVALPWLGWGLTPGTLLAGTAVGAVASGVLGAALTLLLLASMRSFLPYGSRSASAVIRSPHALWFAYASLDGRHGGLAKEHSCSRQELGGAVCCTHVWCGGVDAPAQYVVHEDSLGTVQVMGAPAADHAAAAQRAGELQHKQRCINVDGTEWLLFACKPAFTPN